MNEVNKEIVVLYHANCLDGFGAAYAAWKKFGDTAEYIPVQYGEEVNYSKYWNKGVYIVDFSYPSDILIALEAHTKFVVVIDHHNTAQPHLELALEELDRQEKGDTEHCFNYIFSNNKSGCVLTWEYFHPDKEIPELLLHIQDRDLWKFELEDTKEVCAALASEALYPRDFISWNNINSEEAIKKGKILLLDFQSRCKKLAEKARPCNIPYVEDIDINGEYTFAEGLAINATAEYASDVGNLLAIKSGTYGAVWNYLGLGKYQISLRSIGDYDVSIIAKYYGGGGHKNAAGFIHNSWETTDSIEDIIKELCEYDVLEGEYIAKADDDIENTPVTLRPELKSTTQQMGDKYREMLMKRGFIRCENCDD